jgi:hypothetical protein
MCPVEAERGLMKGGGFMKHRMNYKEFADEVYAGDPQARKLFIHQFEQGWSCWHNPREIKMTYKGREYCYVANDGQGRAYYQNGYGNHIMVDDQKIIEIVGNESRR